MTRESVVRCDFGADDDFGEPSELLLMAVGRLGYIPSSVVPGEPEDLWISPRRVKTAANILALTSRGKAESLSRTLFVLGWYVYRCLFWCGQRQPYPSLWSREQSGQTMSIVLQRICSEPRSFVDGQRLFTAPYPENCSGMDRLVLGRLDGFLIQLRDGIPNLLHAQQQRRETSDMAL
jgi:hypothetical protein